MRAINYHIKGIFIVFEQLSKGRFLLFFLPGIVITLVYWYFRYSGQTLADNINSVEKVPIIGEYLGYAVDSVFSVFGFLLNQLYIFVVLTLLSPFNTALSEKLDIQLTGNKVESNFLRFINEFIRMIFVVLIALTLEFTLIIAYWIISWLFGLGAIDNVVYFIIAAFFFGFSLYDFPLERDGISVFGSIAYAFSNPLSMLLTGGIFLAIYAIPIIGIPIAPVLCVMISTVVYLHHAKRIPENINATRSEEPKNLKNHE